MSTKRSTIFDEPGDRAARGAGNRMPAFLRAYPIYLTPANDSGEASPAPAVRAPIALDVGDTIRRFFR